MNSEKMLEQAKELIKKESDISSFSVSSLIPKDWIIREDSVWDYYLNEKTESIKSAINSRLISAMRKATKLKCINDGDCRIIFDYNKGEVSIQRNELFVFGRYKKLVVGLSQSRWKCNKCEGKGCEECDGKGKHYESVEERIGEPLKTACEADDYILHASGREDVDATNSAGRIFVVAITNPKKRKLNLEKLADEIGKSKEVEVDGLRIVPRSFVEIVTESHFDKSYRAEIEFDDEIDKDRIKEIETLNGKTILQRTPKRVAHRRANLTRHRKIKNIKVLESEGKKAIILITAEAGTYIKELISGDDGRTNPNIAEMFSTKAKCTALDVAEIDDGFIDFLLKIYPN